MVENEYNKSILVIGAGVFGLSTAYELSKRGYNKIVVLDRSTPPVSDGSSVDVSRIIRYDYSDPFYASMAKSALNEWETGVFQPYFYKCGFVMASQRNPGEQDPFIEKCKDVVRNQGQMVEEFENAGDLVNGFPTLKGGMEGTSGYINRIGGWADAAGSVGKLAELCRNQGIDFECGPGGTVQSLITRDDRVVGVETLSGSLTADRTIVATGAWTNQLLNLGSALSSSGQPVGFVQLTAEEAASLAGMPVVINFSSGVFIFPPTPNTHLLKLARHGHGFERSFTTHDDRNISTPRLEHCGVAPDFIPDDAAEALREGLGHFLPQFGDREWYRRRLCWYTDTPEGDFIIDHHPRLKGLFVATGGAGHGFKFLPVLGRHIVDCFENKASEQTRGKWQLNPDVLDAKGVVCNDGSRRGPPRRRLTPEEMARL